jgi:hypothetical protein
MRSDGFLLPLHIPAWQIRMQLLCRYTNTAQVLSSSDCDIRREELRVLLSDCGWLLVRCLVRADKHCEIHKRSIPTNRVSPSSSRRASLCIPTLPKSSSAKLQLLQTHTLGSLDLLHVRLEVEVLENLRRLGRDPSLRLRRPRPWSCTKVCLTSPTQDR